MLFSSGRALFSCFMFANITVQSTTCFCFFFFQFGLHFLILFFNQTLLILLPTEFTCSPAERRERAKMIFFSACFWILTALGLSCVCDSRMPDLGLVRRYFALVVSSLPGYNGEITEFYCLPAHKKTPPQNWLFFCTHSIFFLFLTTLFCFFLC